MDCLKSPNSFIDFLRHAIAMPIIVVMIIPIIIIDVLIEFYHRACFSLYKISYIKRSKYIQIDRHKLKYLTPLQKLFCMYCGYVNGLAGYWVKIAGETERYWCGIKHKKNSNFISPSHHKKFLKYNDKKSFTKKYK